MDTVAVVNVPFELDVEELIKRMHLKPGSPYLKEVQDLAAGALGVANPKAVYRPVDIEERGENFVVIGGIKFTSRVLRINLEEAQCVFPYVVTCGIELEEWSRQSAENLLNNYCADMIKEMVLSSARQSLTSRLDEEFQLVHSANMNPGSLPEWPITEQKPLFELLGDVQRMIGVRLTESCLMYPVKSVSGIHFPKEASYVNCQLCTKEKCPGRKAPYDNALHEQKYK